MLSLYKPISTKPTRQIKAEQLVEGMTIIVKDEEERHKAIFKVKYVLFQYDMLSVLGFYEENIWLTGPREVRDAMKDYKRNEKLTVLDPEPEVDDVFRSIPSYRAFRKLP